MKTTARYTGLMFVILAALAVAAAPSCGGSDATDAATAGDAAVTDAGSAFDAGTATDTGTAADIGAPADAGYDAALPDGGGSFTVSIDVQALPAGVVPGVLALSGDPLVIRQDPNNKFLYVGDTENSKIHALFKKMAASDTVIDFPTPTDMSVNYNTGMLAVTGGNAPKLGLIDPVAGNTLTLIDIPDDTGAEKVRPLIFDHASKEIYVCNPNKGTVTVVAIGGAAPVVTEVTVGLKPIAVDVDRANGIVVVVNGGDDTVSLIQRPDNTVKTVAVGASPVAVRHHITDGRAYVANNGAGTVSKVDTVAGAVTETLTVGAGPSAVAIDKGLNTVYVMNKVDNTVSAFNLNNGKTATINVGQTPIAIAIDEQVPMIFTANEGDNSISIIDYWKNNQVYNYQSLGQGVSRMTIDVDTGTIYLLNEVSKDVTVVGGYKHAS